MNLDQHSYTAQIVDEATYQRMFTPTAWGWLDVVHGGQGGEEGIQRHGDGLVELYTKLPLVSLIMLL